MTTNLEFQTALALPLPELAELFTRCFTGYVVPVHLDYPSLVGMLRVDSVDLAASVIVRSSGRAVGFALVARRGWSSRLAAMAIDPDFRGRKIGSALVAELLRQARQRGDRQCLLEAIEQNPPAIRLYQSAGFQTIRRLVGYRPAVIEGVADPALEEADPAEVGALVAQAGLENLPWQIAPQTLAALTPPHQAFRLGPAAALLTDPSAPTITVRSLIVERESRRKNWGTRLVRALAAKFPGKQFRFSALVPEEVSPAFFQRLGFQQDALSQLQMGIPILSGN
jgi:ribosomal protein S18 acetylase RimI-like enzyme